MIRKCTDEDISDEELEKVLGIHVLHYSLTMVLTLH